MSAHLTFDELRELRNELKIELRRLGGSSAVALREHAGPHEAEAWPGPPLDVAAADAAGAPRRLLRILEALNRLRTDRYGICLACRDPIPFPRLIAIPETSTCVTCS